MLRRRGYLTWVTVMSVTLSILWFYNHSLANNEDVYYKIDKGLYYLKEVFETVSRNYVDELDPEAMSKSAIEGMLKNFDPYTVFFEDPGSNQMRMITRGKYGGVGMEIGIEDDRVTVIAPMEGSPAQRAGIQAGDIITSIEGVSTEKLTLEEASQKLRGKIGTTVEIELIRPGVDGPIRVQLTREEIVLKDVSYAEFVEPGTAYFRLSAFSDKAAQEMKDAIRELQSHADIDRVILDLRGNPGGLLSSAVEVANIFLPPGQLIVSTRGIHERENKFYTRENAVLPTQPLVVLVNQSSASASEIVAGAIQDLDRGVLVGTQTFGKGLVQKVYPIDKITQAYLKITTAKYYVPSGRSIQREDYKKDGELFPDHSDSVEYNPKTNYYTHNGRVVHGGGGIIPDLEVEDEPLDRFLQNLIARGYFFRFAVDYLSHNPGLKVVEAVVVDERLLKEFQAQIESDQFTYEMEGEEELKKFLKTAKAGDYDPDVQDLVQVALQKLQKIKSQQFSAHRREIQRLLEAEFAEKLEGTPGRIRSMLKHDAQAREAMKILRNLPQYQEILAVNK